MSDAFLRVVLDDAPDHQKLGAITLSEVAEANREECVSVALARLEEFHDELGICEAQRVRHRETVRAFVIEDCAVNIAKLELRLRGREPVH